MFTPHRQDVYISPTKQKPQHKVGINSNTHSKPVVKTPPDTTTTINSPSLVPMSPIIPDGPSPSTQSAITPRPKSPPIDPAPPITTNPIDNHTPLPPSHGNSNSSTSIVPPVVPQPNLPVQTQAVTQPSPENTVVINSPPIVASVNPTNTSTISPASVQSSSPDDYLTPLPQPYTPPNQGALLQSKKPNVGSTSQDQSLPPPKHLSLVPTDLKFVVDEKSTDDNIELIPDLLHDACPYDGLFMKIPEDLQVDDRGLLDPSIQAIWMDLQGRCRLCDSLVKSYAVDEHLLKCVKLSANDLKSFTSKIAKVIHADQWDVGEHIEYYSRFELEEEYVNMVFPTIDSYKQFVLDLEQFLNDRAFVVFNRCNIYGLQSRSNILNFKP